LCQIKNASISLRNLTDVKPAFACHSRIAHWKADNKQQQATKAGTIGHKESISPNLFKETP
jgi:hypothetical protein